MSGLVKGSTSVELKLSVPLTSARATIKEHRARSGRRPSRDRLSSSIPDLALHKAGIVVRARRIQGDGDTVIKLRPVDPSTIDAELRRVAAFKIEVDAMPGGFVCSASFQGVCTGQEVLDVASGEMRFA